MKPPTPRKKRRNPNPQQHNNMQQPQQQQNRYAHPSQGLANYASSPPSNTDRGFRRGENMYYVNQQQQEVQPQIHVGINQTPRACASNYYTEDPRTQSDYVFYESVGVSLPVSMPLYTFSTNDSALNFRVAEQQQIPSDFNANSISANPCASLGCCSNVPVPEYCCAPVAFEQMPHNLVTPTYGNENDNQDQFIILAQPPQLQYGGGGYQSFVANPIQQTPSARAYAHATPIEISSPASAQMYCRDVYSSQRQPFNPENIFSAVGQVGQVFDYNLQNRTHTLGTSIDSHPIDASSSAYQHRCGGGGGGHSHLEDITKLNQNIINISIGGSDPSSYGRKNEMNELYANNGSSTIDSYGHGSDSMFGFDFENDVNGNRFFQYENQLCLPSASSAHLNGDATVALNFNNFISNSNDNNTISMSESRNRNRSQINGPVISAVVGQEFQYNLNATAFSPRSGEQWNGSPLYKAHTQSQTSIEIPEEVERKCLSTALQKKRTTKSSLTANVFPGPSGDVGDYVGDVDGANESLDEELPALLVKLPEKTAGGVVNNENQANAKDVRVKVGDPSLSIESEKATVDAKCGSYSTVILAAGSTRNEVSSKKIEVKESKQLDTSTSNVSNNEETKNRNGEAENKLSAAELMKQKIWETMKDEPGPSTLRYWRSHEKIKIKIKTPSEIAAELNIDDEEFKIELKPATPYFKRFVPAKPPSPVNDIDVAEFEGSAWLKHLFKKEVQVRKVPDQMTYQISNTIADADEATPPSSSELQSQSLKPPSGRRSV